ncbi:MAG: M1 family metallopeptidase [Sphingobacteriaceae bacterium]|nr:M1 family metallopeptidase [Sphingobacteriaceae bacterium]
MNKKTFCLILLSCTKFTANFAQEQKVYFQQEVNYKIQVTLNDEQHALSAREEIVYINNSDNELNYIYFHLYPNAYKNNQTALGKQLLKSGKTALFYSTPQEKGYIDSLNFTVNGKSLKWEYDSIHIDICKVFLDAPLKSKDTLILKTPFYVKIPSAKFSRLGHMGQAYFITQWFPKPAVYDKEGWHAMPYLDQGEFFSEYGSFEVAITLPKNYLLASTGDRVNAIEEDNFLNENVEKTIARLELGDYKEYDMGFPPSAKEFKTIVFKQFRVHDFAWFADKRFNVLHDQFELPNTKRIVDSWVFFTNKNFHLWKDAINYINESAFFYSYLLGDYPYNHITAVDGTIMAGGGMEYPNITVIGDASDPFELDVTITHEVGHNWFYGILGSNERDKPWMDEGLNSLYELRYVRAKYPKRKLSAFLGMDSTSKILGLNKTPYWKDKETAYLFSARSNNDQPIGLTSEEFSSFNYGSIVYAKTAIVFDYLMNYMGEDNFDKAMQFYYDKFKFTHPTEADLKKTLTHFNGAELDWFFNDLINSNKKIDYKVKAIDKLSDGSYNILVKNKTRTAVPFAIYAYKEDKIKGLVWSHGFENKKQVGFPPIDADKFVIDGIQSLPEINRKNNSIRTSGLFKKTNGLRINLFTGMENPYKRQLYIIPMGGVNFYNGAMAGLIFHNYALYQKKFEYYINPFFGFKSNTPCGYAEFNYNFLPKNIFRQINIGVEAKSYGYDLYRAQAFNETFGTNYKSLNLNYYKISPFIIFEIKNKDANSNRTQTISYFNHNMFKEVQDIDADTYLTFAKYRAQEKNTKLFYQ